MTLDLSSINQTTGIPVLSLQATEGSVATRTCKVANQSNFLQSFLNKIVNLFKAVLNFITQANREEAPSIKEKRVKDIREGGDKEVECLCACSEFCFIIFKVLFKFC